MKLAQLLQTQRTIRVLGIDDAHYADKTAGSRVHIAAVVCAGIRFEGMLWGKLRKDGMDATESIVELLGNSKFLPQLHLILLDGITFGGGNVVDLPAIFREFDLPVVAVMRRRPDLKKFRYVLQSLPESEERWRRTKAAGEIHQIDGWVFQSMGEEPESIAQALSRLTDRGKVPEALRIAHLIGSAVMLGESTKRA